MASPFEEAFQQDLAAKQTAASQGPGPFQTFVESALYAMPELLGAAPPPEVQAEQAKHPTASFLGGMAGFPVPYVVGERLATKIPQVGRALARIEASPRFAEAPFKKAFASEVVKLLPVELGRVGAAAAFGPELAATFGSDYSGTPEVAFQAAVDLPVFGGLAGGFKFLEAGGKRLFKSRGVTPGANLNASLQEQLSQTLAKQGAVQDPALWEGGVARLQREIRTQEPPKGMPYVGQLAGGVNPKPVNRLFGLGSGASTEKRLFAYSPRDTRYFPNQETVVQKLADVGLTGAEENIQYPRHILAKTRNSIRGIRKAIRGTLGESGAGTDPLGSPWYYRRDTGDGLWVMAREVDRGEWVLFKTDRPGRFMPGAQKWADQQQELAGRFNPPVVRAEPLSADPLAPTEVFDSMARFKRDVPIMDYRGLDVRSGSVKDLAEKMARRLGLDKLADSELALRGKEFVQANLAPTMIQSRGNPWFAHMFSAAKVGAQAAKARAERIFLGGKVSSGAKTPLGAVLRAPKVAPEGSINGLIDELYRDPAQVEAYSRTAVAGVSPEEGTALFGLEGVGRKLWEKQLEEDAKFVAGVQATQRATGQTVFTPLPWHGMLSRGWKGDWRVPVLEGNKLIGWASGTKRGLAVEEAQRMVELAGKNGRTLWAGRPALVGDVEGEYAMLKRVSQEDAKAFGTLRERLMMSRKVPGTLTHSRTGAEGYQKLFTKEELKQKILGHLQKYELYNANITMQHLYQKELDRLGLEDPAVAEQLKLRINDVFGIQSPFEKLQNKLVDSVASPWFGANSASKLTSTLNKSMFHLTFGFMNGAFNVANALAFVQTAFPHISYIASTAPARLARDYIWLPALGEASVGGVGFLDMMRLGAKSFRELGSGDPQLLRFMERALGDGTVDPTFVEAWVGKNSTNAAAWREVLAGQEGMANWLGAVSTALPSTTEKFARGHALALGRVVFRDLLGITDEEALYQLSKQFTERTQFLYSTADRARIITGPLGSSFGLFKNWMMHYLSWMLEYTGEGVLRGNWQPLLWAVGTTGTMAGVGGLPLYYTADKLSEWLSDKSIMDHTYTRFGDGADGLFYGLPAMFGFSVQNQMAAPFMDPGKDAARLMNFAWVERAKALGRGVGQALDYSSATGQSPARDARTRTLMMYALAPSSIYKATMAVQEATLRSNTTGYPVMELSPGERFTYGALGLQPLDVARMRRVEDELWRSETARKEAITAAGKAWADMAQEKDWPGMKRLIRRALADGLDVGKVVDSGQAMLYKDRQPEVERNFSPEVLLGKRAILQQAGGS